MDLAVAESLARTLIARHAPRGWEFAWDRAVRRAGAAHHRDRTITLSRRLTELHDEAQVRDTVLHEIAHAVVGPRHGHDATWRRAALDLGASGERCIPEGAPAVAGRWVGVCPNGHETTRHRTPTRVASCSRCARGFDRRYLLTWTCEGRSVPMHPAYVAELRSLSATPEGQPARPAAATVEVGRRVRVTAPGRYHGRTGVVVARRRTRYAVEVAGMTLAVPFHLVEAA